MQASEVRSLLQEVDRLTKLVQDLLILARVDAGMGAPEFHPLVFEDLILEVVQKAQKIAKTKDIRVVFNIHNQESSSFQIPGVEDLLSHLVLNLVENAIKYSRAESTVTITLFQNPQSQLLVVEDQGDGVSDEDLCLIFERFHRGSSKSQQNRPGYGLGLAIAKRISRLHKGHLSVENIVNSEGYKIGARFSFELNNF